MSQTESAAKQSQQDVAQDLADYKFGWADRDDQYSFTSQRGLTRGTVEEISALKDEPEWMRDLRLRSYDAFLRRPMPNWGSDLSGIDF
ncbi:MAG: Fe-S cluster assembly protein SufB, partial [Actinobacteria bacterium]|nr:Fe-S cluster assembly protein SufB [Actinomycetota bacterium]